MCIDLRKILGLPTKSNELTYWGITDLKKGRYESALRYFNEALKLDPDNKFIKEKIDDTNRKIASETIQTPDEADQRYT
jgi:tetratricopeptide (TPR) repeat protein